MWVRVASESGGDDTNEGTDDEECAARIRGFWQIVPSSELRDLVALLAVVCSAGSRLAGGPDVAMSREARVVMSRVSYDGVDEREPLLQVQYYYNRDHLQRKCTAASFRKCRPQHGEFARINGPSDYGVIWLRAVSQFSCARYPIHVTLKFTHGPNYEDGTGTVVRERDPPKPTVAAEQEEEEEDEEEPTPVAQPVAVATAAGAHAQANDAVPMEQ